MHKTLASTLGGLSQASKELFGQLEKQTQVIVTRHGEKFYESLTLREGMALTVDIGATTVFLQIIAT